VAFIVLWFAPAANILALTYTDTILGSEMVISRIIAALLMAFIVGSVMTLFFGKKDNPGRVVQATMGEREEKFELISGMRLFYWY
jgi:hypothetical protein